FEGGRVPMKQLLKDLLTAYKFGLKTLYYQNTRDGADDAQADMAADCAGGACKIWRRPLSPTPLPRGERGLSSGSRCQLCAAFLPLPLRERAGERGIGRLPTPTSRNNHTTSGSPRGQHENEIQHLFPDRQQPDERADVLRPAGQRRPL